ncbi:MAG: hypothetical protein ACJ72I_11320 [Pseudonocardiaceae bacterium]
MLSCVVNPLDRPCDELGEPPGSELCTVDGAVLCVVGVACGPDTEPPDAPGAVLCVVGVACWPDTEPLDAPGAGLCVADVEAGDDGDIVPVGCVLSPETVPDEVEPPRSACGALGCGAGWDPPSPVPVSACGAPPGTAPCWPPLSPWFSPLPLLTPPC